MPRRGTRKRIAVGIYEDASGLAAVARVGEWRKEKRFPPNTPLKKIRSWMDAQRRRWRASGVATPARGTFAHDVDHYLQMVRHLSGWIPLRAELRRWIEALPADIRRHAITVERVIEVRNRWLDAGIQPKTCNNRIAALSRLWHRLDGRDASAPCDQVTPLHVHRTPAKVIDAATVRGVYENLLAMEERGVLRDAKTRARFMLMASTGKRPSEIVRAQRGDVDLERRVWIVRDGKGGWSPGVYLNDDMLAAWQVFIQADAWGKFREGSLVITLRSAGWPTGVRPYQLRHTVGMLMSEGGTDLADIQQHMGHKRIETTRRHYVPVLGSRLQKASELLAGRFGWSDTGDRGTNKRINKLAG